MKNSPNAQRRRYSRLYAYSKRYIPYRTLQKIGLEDITEDKILNSFIPYGFSIVSSLLILYLTYSTNFFPEETSFYTLYLILILLSASIGGINSALLSTAIISVGAFFMISDANSLIQFIFFIIGASVISFVVDGIRQTNTINRLKKQEKIYAQSFVKLQNDYAKAKEEIKSRDEFLSIISHELRTPLTTMLLKLHNLLNTVHNVPLANFSVPELMKALQGSEQQIKRLTVMINDLLDISLITTGRMELKLEKADLVEITKRVLENFSEVLKKEKFQIKFEAKSPISGRFDKMRMEQAITNLLSNAIKYGRGKPINIQISDNKKIIKLTIEDQGVGIPTQDQKLIFGLFKRTDSTNEHSNGLGVGLYIASQIVKAHGGKINLSSKPLKGSTFTLELPLNAPYH
ncbi:MAG: HAMP domain-containing sensor histidine kinase [Candidatus Daviesbacteria bacterium]|nr:HAMP domain-containing sensor histidine kinase [Candidatus Daviesbacteria bacterium]